MADDKRDQASDPGGVAKPKVLHIYDGDLHEEDNQLPNWWLWLFYGTITFGVIYWLVYHDMKVADQPDEAYRKEVAALQAAEAKKLGNQAVTPESLLAMSKDASFVAAGKDVFMANCVACHKADASGLVGPNLTDAYWIHGGAPDKVYKSVHDGWVDKGMAAWAPQIGEEKVRQVVAYVITLKNTNVAGGKAAQGDKE